MTDLDATYPEHAKLRKIIDKSQAVGEFMDWLEMEKGIQLVNFTDYREDGTVVSWRPLLAEHFGIDEQAIEAEKRAMLDVLRSAQ